MQEQQTLTDSQVIIGAVSILLLTFCLPAALVLFVEWMQ